MRALAPADDLIRYAQQAGHGPWTQLANQGQRLKTLSALGEHTPVLAEARRLLHALEHLPAPDTSSETIDAWNVRENLLDTAG
ncbi:hypothetical protein [Allosalinactinospora lopnorensis]|uniref:hypothetical protein n=1 Tax=Allosalinactinospora lopnorensis TaxID=1352348 RepID=UPI00138ECD48|nr:hypothetical protein [Allosalinactinospora lopnorensis]